MPRRRASARPAHASPRRAFGAVSATTRSGHGGAERRLAGLAGGIAQQTVDAGEPAKRSCAHAAGPADAGASATSATLAAPAEPRMMPTRATCF